ncbi:MAG: hypothetical protein ACOCRX_02360, partial [Candidatus Woesearchaeota archaeon]
LENIVLGTVAYICYYLDEEVSFLEALRESEKKWSSMLFAEILPLIYSILIFLATSFVPIWFFRGVIEEGSKDSGTGLAVFFAMFIGIGVVIFCALIGLGIASLFLLKYVLIPFIVLFEDDISLTQVKGTNNRLIFQFGLSSKIVSLGGYIILMLIMLAIPIPIINILIAAYIHLLILVKAFEIYEITLE